MKFSTFNEQANQAEKIKRDMIFLESVGDILVEGAGEFQDFDHAVYADVGEMDDEDGEDGDKESSKEPSPSRDVRGLGKHDVVQGLIVKPKDANGRQDLEAMLSRQGYGDIGIESGNYLQTYLKKGATFNKPSDASDPNKKYPKDHLKGFVGNKPLFIDAGIYRRKAEPSKERELIDILLKDKPEYSKYFRDIGWYVDPTNKTKRGDYFPKLMEDMAISVKNAIIEKRLDRNKLNLPNTFLWKSLLNLVRDEDGHNYSKNNTGNYATAINEFAVRNLRMDFDTFIDSDNIGESFVMIPIRITDQDKKVKDRMVFISRDILGLNTIFKLYKSSPQDDERLKRTMYSELRTARTDLQWNNANMLEAAHLLGAVTDLTKDHDILEKALLDAVKDLERVKALKKQGTSESLAEADKIVKHYTDNYIHNSYRALKDDKSVYDSMNNVINALENASKAGIGNIASTMAKELKGQTGLEAFYKISRYARGMNSFVEDVVKPNLGKEIKFITNATRENELNQFKKQLMSTVAKDDRKAGGKVATFDTVFISPELNYNKLMSYLDEIERGGKKLSLDVNNENGVISILDDGKKIGSFILASLKSKKATSNIGKVTSAFSDVIQRTIDVIDDITKNESVVFVDEKEYEMPSFDDIMSYDSMLSSFEMNEGVLDSAKEKIQKGFKFIKDLGKAAYEKVRAFIAKIRAWKDKAVNTMKTALGMNFKKDVMSFLTMMDLSENIVVEAENIDDPETETKRVVGEKKPRAMILAQEIASAPEEDSMKWWRNAIDKVSARFKTIEDGEGFDKFITVPSKIGDNLGSDTVLHLAGNYASVPVANKMRSMASSMSDELKELYSKFASETKAEAAFGSVGDLPVYKIFGFVPKGQKTYEYMETKKVASKKGEEKIKAAQSVSKSDNETKFPTVIFSATPAELTKGGAKKEAARAAGGKEDKGEVKTTKKDKSKHQYTGYWVQYMWLLDDLSVTKDGIAPTYTEYRIGQQRDGNLFVEAIKDKVSLKFILNKVSNPVEIDPESTMD